MKNISLALIGLFVFNFSPAFAADTSAEEKALEAHQLASSDVIYSQEEPKALYYQNLQIIDLLKEIRDILDERLRAPKDSKG